MITQWSFSRLLQYESCPMRTKLKVIDRSPEPPLPPDNPMERGNREHGRYERYIKGDASALNGAEARQLDLHRPNLDKLAELYAAGMATAEQNWKFDADWEIIDGEDRDYWLFAKLDAYVFNPETCTAIAVDFKTGKSMYKAIEHVQQLQFYAALSALREERADTIICELWYVDESDNRTFELSREQALSYVGRFQKRADTMMSDKIFRPNPNKVTCRYCPYSPRGTGVCPVGV